MGWHLDGKVTLVVGTHTHVQTADERILPNGTAYLTDAGMTGPHDSIIGMEREPSLARFLNGDAVAIRAGHRQSAPERRHRRRRRQDRTRDSAITRGSAIPSGSILATRAAPVARSEHVFFDLPFEEPEPEPSEPEPRHPGRRAARSPPSDASSPSRS